MKKKGATRWIAYIMTVAMLLGLAPQGFQSRLGIVQSAKADAILVAGAASMAEATSIVGDTEYMDSLSEVGEEDWFQFTTPDYDSYLKLYVKNINIAYSNSNFSTVIYTEANEPKLTARTGSGDTNTQYVKLQRNTTYYMRFRHPNGTQTGDYTFSIKFCKDEDNNTLEQASGIHLDTKYEKDLAAPGDEDWYQLQINNSQQYTVNVKNNNMEYNSGNFYIAVYTSNRERLLSLSAENGKSNSDQVVLEAGNTYYIRLDHPSITFGNYSFSVCTSSDVEPVSSTSADSICHYQEDALKITGGDSVTNAVPVIDGKNYLDDLSENGEVDWYQFTTPAYDSYVELYVKNINIAYSSSNFSTVIYTGANEPKLTARTGSGDTKTQYVKLQKNTTYYLKFYHPNGSQTGNYVFSVNFCKDEDGNTKEEASLLSLNTQYEKDLAASGDEDWFVVTPSTTQTYTLYIKNNNMGYNSGNFYTKINSENEETLLSISAENGKETTGTVELTSGNSYYIRVAHPGSSTGNYNFYLADAKDATITTIHAEVDADLEHLEVINASTVAPIETTTQTPTTAPTAEPATDITEAPATEPTTEPTRVPSEELAESVELCNIEPSQITTGYYYRSGKDSSDHFDLGSNMVEFDASLNTTVEYQLNGSYTDMSGTVCTGNYTGDGVFSVAIYGDDNLLAEITPISVSGKSSEDFYVSLQGVQTMKIVSQNTGSWSDGWVYIKDGVLKKDRLQDTSQDPTQSPTETPAQSGSTEITTQTYSFTDDNGVTYLVTQNRINGVITGYSDVSICAVDPTKFNGVYPATVKISSEIDVNEPIVSVSRISCDGGGSADQSVYPEKIIISEGIQAIDRMPCYYTTSCVEIPDSVSYIGWGENFGRDDVTILCNPGSYAETYADTQGLNKQYISGDNTETDTTTPDNIVILPATATPWETAVPGSGEWIPDSTVEIPVASASVELPGNTDIGGQTSPQPAATTTATTYPTAYPVGSSSPNTSSVGSKLSFTGVVTEVTVGQGVLNSAVLESDGAVVNNATIIYTSSDVSIATVSDSGLVTGVLPGTVTITARYGQLTASYQLTVTTGSFTGIRVAKSGKTLKVKAVKGAKVTVIASRWYMGKSKKTAKANAKGIAKIKFKRRIKGKVVIKITKAGYKAKKITKRYR